MKGWFCFARVLDIHARPAITVALGLFAVLSAELNRSVASADDRVIQRLNILTGRAASDYRFVAPDSRALTDWRSVDVGQWLPQLHQGFREHVGAQNRRGDQRLNDLTRGSDQHYQNFKRQLDEQKRIADQQIADIKQKSEQIERALNDMVRGTPHGIEGIPSAGRCSRAAAEAALEAATGERHGIPWILGGIRAVLEAANEATSGYSGTHNRSGQAAFDAANEATSGHSGIYNRSGQAALEAAMGDR